MRSTPTGDARNAAGASAVVRRFRFLVNLWPWLAAVFSGILYAACFAPLDQAWLCWIALIPLIAAVWFGRSTSTRAWLRNLLLGYAGGLVFFTATFYWLGSLGILFGNLALCGLPFLLSIYLAVHLAFWAWFLGLIRPKSFHASHRNLAVAFLGACAWVTHEWIRGWLFGGFGWNGLGVALHAQWPLVQIAEFTGVTGVSFAIAFANIVALTVPFRLFEEARTQRMRPHWDLNLTVLALVAMFIFGWRAAKHVAPSKSIRVAAVQPAIPQNQKFDRQFAREINERLYDLSHIVLRANARPDLLVWPESATPHPLFEDEPTREFVLSFAANEHVDLLLGSDVFEQERVYNSALLLRGGASDLQVYHKIHLVPFGEYVPLRHSFPLFAMIAGHWVPGDFDRGREYSVFTLTKSEARVAPLICFEDTVGDLVRQFVRRDADLLVNITNDGWFLHSAGSEQHLANAVFRCVENRRPMMRAANTGVTCFVDEFGRVTQILRDDTGSTFTPGVLTGTIDLGLAPASPSGGGQDRQLTFYTRHGELFAQGCAAVTALALGVILIRRKWR